MWNQLSGTYNKLQKKRKRKKEKKKAKNIAIGGMVMYTYLLAIQITLNTLNVVVHGQGLLILVYMYKNGTQNTRHQYMMSLSISEASYNLLVIIATVVSVFSSAGQCYLRTVRDSGVLFTYYATMIYITTDRLFDILLNLKYPLYWNELKTTKLLKGTWGGGFAICLFSLFANAFTGLDFRNVRYTKYVSAFFDFTFPILASVTYASICSCQSAAVVSHICVNVVR